jgi:hypothetical protein
MKGMKTDEMAWYRNQYDCDRCGGSWTDEWSCMCDDDCPHCGARHMSPTESEDLTDIVVCEDGMVVFLSSPSTAEHYPDYRWVTGFPIKLGRT